jgi:hypothetical protein
MTKLEQLWDDFPVRRPATPDLVRAARAAGASRRRRLVLRPLALGGVAAAVATAFVLGTVTAQPQHPGDSGVTAADGAGGADAATHALGSDASPVAFVTGLTAPSSCEALLTSYKTRAEEYVTAWGWQGVGWVGAYMSDFQELRGGMTDMVKRTPMAASNSSDGVSGALASKTGTNVQEAGVDEPDLAKTDGRLLVRVTGSRLDVFDVSGPEVERTGTLNLGRITDASLLLSGSTAVVLSTVMERGQDDPDGGSRMTTVSLADPARPRVTGTTTFSAGQLTARQTGSTIRMVMSSGMPSLKFVMPKPKKRTKAQALAHNRAVLRNSTLEDWLPTYDDGGGSKPLLACDAVALPADDLVPGTVAVIGFDVADPTTLSGVGIATSTELTYQNGDRLYLAGSSPVGYDLCMRCDFTALSSRSGTASASTSLFAFALDGISARHIASGEVDGYLRDRWSMDAVGDTLRLAVTQPGGVATEVDTFDVEGTTLKRIGRLGGIGKDESLQSVRWFDDLALVVTYRQTDPLFAIDLSDPAHPREISHLKALGYSTYLHPLDSGRILGIGVSGILGRAKATLFDVSDLSAMREAGVVRFDRGTYAAVGYETHAFTWLPDQQVALTPLDAEDGSIDLAMIRVSPTGLSESTLTLRGAYDGTRKWSATTDYSASSVRTLTDAQGRAIVVTPDQVTFVSVG